MKMFKNARRGLHLTSRSRQVILAAVGCVGLAGSMCEAATTLFFDSNGNANGLGTAGGTWNNVGTNKDWASTSLGTSTNSWQPGAIAAFGATQVTTVTDVVSVAGLVFNGGGNGGTTPNLTVAGAGPWALDFGSNPFSIINNTATKQIIAVPIRGSGDMTIVAATVNTTAPIDLAGDLSLFTGNIFVNNNEPNPSATNASQLQLDSAPGNPNATIFLDRFVQLQNNNQVSGLGTPGGVATPNNYTIPNNIVLNYNGINNVSDTLGCSASGVAGVQKFVNFSGNISSGGTPTTVTNLIISGTNGCTTLSGSNSYTGSTTVNNSATTGMFRIGNDRALPATTTVIFASGGPMDLNGHNITVSAISTTNTADSITADGNIYNIYPSSGSETPASVTLTPASTTSNTFKGDIGVTQNTTAFFNNTPNLGNISAGKNISLTINGPTGGGTNTLTLAPTPSEANGNEYTGTTTVNSNATLVAGRQSSYTGTPGSAYTVTGNGNVTINNGAVLASVPTNATTYAGGFNGNVELKSGAKLIPGGTGATGVLSTNSMTIDGGATLNFELGTSPALFDQLYLNGGLTLDNTGNSTLNLALLSGVTSVTPGTYTLINATQGINSDGVHGITFGTLPSTSHNTFFPQINGNLVQVVVTASTLQWDPSGSGAGSPPVQEQGGTWTDGTSTFVDLSTLTPTEATWSNAATKDVLIGNNPLGTGGTITLGSNINVNGGLTFGPIFAGFNYSITDGGSGNMLTLGGGVNVTNAAARYNADGSVQFPSAEIDSAITLSADQTWSVDPGQFFDVKGQLIGNSTTLTKIGAGTVFFEHSGGSLGTLNVNGGVVQLAASDSIGTANIKLDGGGVVLAFSSALNNVSVGPNGGLLGVTSPGLSVSLASNLNTAGSFTVVGGGTVTLAGTNTVGTLSALGGYTVVTGDNTIGTVILSGGTLQIGAGTTSGALLGAGSIKSVPIAVGTSALAGGLVFNRSDTITFAGSLSGGSFSVQQSGPGTTILTGTNTYTGGTQVNNGTLMLGTSSALGPGGTLNLNGPVTGMAVLDLAGFNQTIQGLRDGTTSTPANALITNSSPTLSTLSIANTGNSTYNGGFSGNLLILHTGTATETLGGNIAAPVNNNGTGGVVLASTSTLTGDLTNSGGGAVVGNGTIIGNVSNADGGTMSITGLITGNSTVSNLGSSTLSLSGTNDFTGTVTVQAGTLSISTYNPLGTPGPLGNPSAGNQTITLGRNGTTGIFDYEGSESFTFGRPISMVDGGAGGLRINNAAATITIPAGTITGSGGLMKLGGGTLVIVGAQAYRGVNTLIRGNINVDTLANIGQPSALGTGDANANSAAIVFGDASGNSATLSFNSATPQSTNRPITENQNGGGGINIMAGDASAPGAVATSNLTLTGGIDLTNSISTTGGTIVFGGAGIITVSGNPIIGANGHVFVGTNTTGDPSLVGTGTLVLSANNTYGGGTYIRNGTLKVSSDSNLGAAGASVNFASVGTEAGTLMTAGAVTGTRPLVMSTAGTVNTQGFNSAFGNLTGSGTVSIIGGGNVSMASLKAGGLVIGSATSAGGAGTVSVSSARSIASTGSLTSLSIAGSTGAWTAALDTGANDLVVAGGDLSTIADQIKSGYHNGDWLGTGIRSSAAAASIASGHPTGLGFSTAAVIFAGSGGSGTFSGVGVGGSNVLIRYTLAGDSNLDGVVNTGDFNAIAQNFNATGKTWTDGDGNYDGVVNALDFNAVATNFGQSLPSAPVLGTLVPEPASIGMLALAGIGMARRRRRSP